MATEEHIPNQALYPRNSKLLGCDPASIRPTVYSSPSYYIIFVAAGVYCRRTKVTVMVSVKGQFDASLSGVEWVEYEMLCASRAIMVAIEISS